MIFVKTEKNPALVKADVSRIVGRIRHNLDESDQTCALIYSESVITGEQRVTIHSHAGGYSDFVEAMVLQLLSDVAATKGVSWKRRFVYRMVFRMFGLSKIQNRTTT